MTSATLVLAAPALLALGVALQLALSRLLSPRVKGALALLCAVPALGAVLALLPAVQGGGAVDVLAGAWDGPLRLALHVDALSVLFAAMGTGIGSIVLLYSVGYMAEDRAATRFYALMLTFIGGLVSLVYSANLFLVYFSWELVGLCSFGLVGFWYRRPEAVSGARKVLLMTHLAGYGLLAAILVLYARTGSALWTDPGVANAFSGGVFLLMLLALVAKSVQFPLHTWIPEAMAAPTPVSALLHAACYVKAGVYLAARMHSFGPWQASWSATVVGVGTVTMLVGAMYALVQGDLKRMLAFSTVSQIGYMITGLGIGTPLAITAALLHCLNHGFFKGGLFLAAGSVQHAAGTREMDQLGGLAQRMPRTTAAWLISAGSMMGVPLMSGFASKWMLYSAALEAGQLLPALAAWVASIGTVFYCAKATSAVFLGPASEATEHAHESPPSMQWGLGIVAAGSVVLSVAPQLPVNYLVNPVLAALGMRAGVEVSWFGLAGSTGVWWTTAGLGLAVLSVVLGALVYRLASPPRVAVQGAGALAGGGVFTGGEPMPGTGRLTAGDFSEILLHHWGPFYRWADVDRAYLALWGWLRASAGAAARGLRWAEERAVVAIVVLAALLLGAVAWLGAGAPAASELPLPGIPPLLAAGVGAGCAALLLAALAGPAWRRHAPLMALAGAAAVAGLCVEGPLLRLGLLEGASAVALLLVWRAARAPATRVTYLAVVLVSAAALVGGELLLHGGDPRWARALLATGFFVKLGVVPLFLWLPRIAEDLPALVLGLLVAVLDVAAFGELWALAQAAPWLAEPRALWLGGAILSALAGGLLMLAQRDLKRLLVLSTVEDVGFLLLGVAVGGEVGPAGALLGAVVHALGKALLFASLSAPEADGALSGESAGLASSYPVSGAGFLVGMLAVLGVPPALGFAGRWRLYAAAEQVGPWVLLAFAAASALALVAYALALTRAWWGPRPEGAPAAREPALLRLVLLGLIALLVAGGIWPAALHALTGSLP
jgi:NADH:ubiquinone oxidoreductase subunit 5 (subunit L)/multisubunit Na+/H+ antiporter MnhA subunit